MARKIRTIVDGLSFAEGPRWRGGALYIADMHGNRVLRIGEGGRYESVAELDGPVSGIGWLPDGRLLIVSMNDRRLMRQEPDGRIVLHGDLNAVADWHANDMAVAADGTAYVGNFGFSLHPPGEFRSTALAMVAPDGTVTAAADELWFPNGIAISEDGRTLTIDGEAAFRAEVRAWLDTNAPKRIRGSGLQQDMKLADAKAWQAKKADAGYACLTWPLERARAPAVGWRPASPCSRETAESFPCSSSTSPTR